jgi:hypothetical protein
MVQTGLAAIGETGAGVATGFVKGMGDTVSGVSHLINKIPVVGETLAPSAGITSLDQRDVSHGTAEMAGKGLEGIAEFAAGDEALEGLSKASKLVALAKKYPAIAETLNMASKNKMLEKIITGGAKNAVVGAAQGGVKGAQEDNAVKGAAEGGATAGVLGGLTEAAPDVFNWMARTSGLGGHTYGEAMTMAGRPNVKEGKKFVEALDGTKDILTTIPNKAVKDVGDFEDAVHNKANELWATQVQPIVDKHKDLYLDLTPTQTAVQAAVTRGMKTYFPEEAAQIERFAGNFGASTIGQANEDLQLFNARLKGYYKQNSMDQAAALKNSAPVAMLEAAADSLRDQIYGAIDSQEKLPAGTTAGLRRQYGQLRDIERTFGKRAVVVDRQAPLNVAQVLMLANGATRLLAGDPTGAAEIAIPYITKARQSAKSLVKQGLSAGREEAGNPGLVARAQTAAGTVAKNTVPNVATQAVNASLPQGTPSIPETPVGFATISDSRGGIHQVPLGAIPDLQQKDPGLKIIESK